MELFDKEKCGAENLELENKETPEAQNKPDLSQKTDYITRPGGIFAVQLLMKEKCEMPSNERFFQVLSKYLGNIEQFGSRGACVQFAAKDYISKFKDGSGPIMLSISDCDEFEAEKIDDFQRSQMWDCQHDRENILSDCKFQIFAHDTLGSGLPAKVRANMLMDYLEALLELYPQCEAVYILNSGKLIKAEHIREKKIPGIQRFIEYAVNFRFFNIQGTENSLVDTIGLSLLFIEDLQYHFHGIDPNEVVFHAHNMALYLLNNDNPMKNGDTIDGVRNGSLAQDIQWKCYYEGALIQPARSVIDICMGEYAAGKRD